MEIASNLMADLRGRLGRPGPDASSGAPAWSDLHARLAAAHAAAGELSRASSRISGDFTLWASAGANTSPRVNPAGLADGKLPGCNSNAFAGNMISGERGHE